MTSRSFVAFCLSSPETTTPARIGFTVPRAIGKAVLRNRVKRRMRAAVRQSLGHLRGGCSVVINPRRRVAEVRFDDLCREVGEMFTKCNEQ